MLFRQLYRAMLRRENRKRTNISLIVILFFTMLYIKQSGIKYDDCTPDFPHEKQWYGGDVGYAITLDKKRTLWLFGETYIRQQDNTSLLPNSIAISRCPKVGGFHPNYFWEKDQTPKPFFHLPKSNTALRPLSGLIHQDTLYIILSQLRSAQTPRGYQENKPVIAHIKNYHDRPYRWQITYTKLKTPKDTLPGLSNFMRGDFLYLYTRIKLKDKNDYAITLSRLPLAMLNQPKPQISILDTKNHWRTALPISEAKQLLSHVPHDIDVSFHPENQQWLAIFTSKDAIQSSTASSPFGPWSPKKPLFYFSERDIGPNAISASQFCHSTKQHKNSSKNKELTITYSCGHHDPAIAMRTESYFQTHILHIPWGNVQN